MFIFIGAFFTGVLATLVLLAAHFDLTEKKKS